MRLRAEHGPDGHWHPAAGPARLCGRRSRGARQPRGHGHKRPLPPRRGKPGGERAPSRESPSRGFPQPPASGPRRAAPASRRCHWPPAPQLLSSSPGGERGCLRRSTAGPAGPQLPRGERCAGRRGSRVVRCRAEPSRAVPCLVGVSRAVLSRVAPCRAEPCRAGGCGASPPWQLRETPN